MKVIVLGSGVIGVATAYELSRAGHAVTVVDRQAAAGLETSYANAGEVSPGYASPWAGPGVPVKAVKWLLMRHRPLVIRPHVDRAMLRWCLSVLANCTTQRYEVNKGRMLRLAEYSRDRLRALRDATGIAYDERMQGTLQLFRNDRQLEGAALDAEVLGRYGVAHQILDVDGCIRREPALAAVREKFVGGLHLPGDETGDCLKFTQALAALVASKGVEFRYGTRIERLVAEGGSIVGVVTSAGRLEADAYLVALGSHSPLILEPLGIRIPVYPVKGYSITVPIVTPSAAPESTVMDESHKVAVTRLGDRIRAGGTAELAGYTLELHDARRKTLEHVVADLFPGSGDISKATFWCGLRPMTPDGPPILGPTRYRNLYLATGHGTLGWTMAAGTARVMADVISGVPPEIDMSGLTIERYGDARG